MKIIISLRKAIAIPINITYKLILMNYLNPLSLKQKQHGQELSLLVADMLYSGHLSFNLIMIEFLPNISCDIKVTDSNEELKIHL